MMDGISALYVFVLAGVAGYVLIARVPSVLHLPLLSGANFVHGVVLCGAMLVLAQADDNVERTLGFLAVALAAGNVVGGYLVTDRLLALFDRRAPAAAGADGEAAVSVGSSDAGGPSGADKSAPLADQGETQDTASSTGSGGSSDTFSGGSEGGP